jgi:ADP-ribose pyrophosphatase YjhB (NUDIX family)
MARRSVYAGAAPVKQPRILARGPWAIERVKAHWIREQYQPSPAYAEAADAEIESLKQRGSPSHDGTAARLVDYTRSDDGLLLELQPLRWALRLVAHDASFSVAALCVTRSAEGQWLAGRRASWLASWAGRWGLGAGGAVDAWEEPTHTLTRELREEWSVSPERIRGEALIELPHKLVMFIGQAWLPRHAEVTPDHEHDAFSWWPPEIDDWPAHAEEGVRRLARLLDECAPPPIDSQ